jgi:hypothetical protein
MNRIHEGIGIMYKKEQFVFHLVSTQSILYLYSPYLPTQIRPSTVNDIIAIPTPDIPNEPRRRKEELRDPEGQRHRDILYTREYCPSP